MRNRKELVSGLIVAALGVLYLAPGLSLASLASASAASLTQAKVSAADAQTIKVVDAANAFLATLTPTQRRAVQFAWTDQAQRARWSYLPQGVFNRAGVRWGELNLPQRAALMNLLGTVLSADGLKLVKDQMNADDIWKSTGATNPVQIPSGVLGSPPPPGGSPAGAQPPAGGAPPAGADGGRPQVNFSSDYYFVSFLGRPSATSPWMLQFGSHHLAINATVVGPNITLAPSVTGGEPIRATVMGHTYAVVSQVPQEVKDAFAILSNLTSAQRSKVIISTQPIDLVLGAGQDGRSLQPEGLPGNAMTTEQKAQLLTLIRDRLGLLNADDLAPKLADIQKNLDRTYFAWFGPVTPDGGAYFRVTGPTVLIEFSPQQLGGDPPNHIHSIYRDPTNDYGAAWTR